MLFYMEHHLNLSIFGSLLGLLMLSFKTKPGLLIALSMVCVRHLKIGITRLNNFSYRLSSTISKLNFACLPTIRDGNARRNWMTNQIYLSTSYWFSTWTTLFFSGSFKQVDQFKRAIAKRFPN